MRLKFKVLFLPIFLLVTNLIIPQNDTTQTTIEAEIIPFEELMKMGIEIASMQEKNIFNTPSTVSVIDKETIKRYNFTSVSEALNNVAGFEILRNYLKRQLPTSRGILQDNYANKVLIMINGTPTWHASTGEGNIDRINIADVERIEVLKGPASVLYGTNAYTGAVNIVLKKQSGNSASAYVRVSENFLFQSGANVSINEDGYQIFISANTANEKGFDYLFEDQANVAGHVNEYVKANNFTLNATAGNHNFLFNTYKVDESYLGVSPRFSAGAGNDHLLFGNLFSYSFEQNLGSSFLFNAEASYDWNRRDLSRTLDDNTRADIVGSRLSGLLNFIYNPTDNFSLQLGSEYSNKESIKYDNYNVQNQTVLEENYMKGKSVYDLSVFGQTEYSISQFTILLGLRYNNNELFGGHVSTRGTVVYQLDSKNSFKFVYGTSYRSPSLFELYFRTSTNTVFGNTKLDPEESTSFELSYLTSIGNFFVQALGYYADYTNKIFRTTGTVVLDDGTTKNNVSYYVNGNKFSAKGIELELKYTLPKNFDAFVNLSYVDGDNGDEVNGNSHYNFKYVPQTTVSVGLAKDFGKADVSCVFNFMSEQGSVKSKIAPQHTLDLATSFEHKVGIFNLRHTLSAKNLLNRTILFPEYVSRALSSVPSGYGRVIFYSLGFEF